MRIFLKLFWIAATLGMGTAANAETLREMPGCFDGFGDIWGEKSARIRSREIDGSTIKSITEFARITGTRELGLKVVKGGDFSGWDFRKIPLHQVCFQESKLTGANLAGAEGTGTGFIKTDLTGADMQGAVMPRVMFRNANLTNASAQNANFFGGHFDGGWFEGAVAGWNIDGATMTEFTFECGITLPDGCPVYQGGDPISARGADLTRATLHSLGLHNVELDGAILDGTIVGPRQLPFLSNSDMRGDIVMRGGKSDIAITPSEARRLFTGYTDRQSQKENPSFDCAKVDTKIEGKVCDPNQGELRSLDRDMAKLYVLVQSDGKWDIPRQREWLKTRDDCIKDEYFAQCLMDTYDAIIGKFIGMLGEQNWLTIGETALFVDEVLELPSEFRKSDLFEKIRPALIGASMTEILVSRENDGLYSIKGSAVGANAHLCSLSATHLHLDKKTGWYTPVSKDMPAPIFRIYDGRLKIYENGRPDYEKYPDAGDYMSCGMRASFSNTIRIEADAETLAKFRKSLEETM